MKTNESIMESLFIGDCDVDGQPVVDNCIDCNGVEVTHNEKFVFVDSACTCEERAVKCDFCGEYNVPAAMHTDCKVTRVCFKCNP